MWELFNSKSLKIGRPKITPNLFNHEFFFSVVSVAHGGLVFGIDSSHLINI